MYIAPVQEEHNIKTHNAICKILSTEEFCGPTQTKQGNFQLHPPKNKYTYVLFVITTPNPSAVGQSKVVKKQVSVRHGKQPTMN